MKRNLWKFLFKINKYSVKSFIEQNIYYNTRLKGKIHFSISLFFIYKERIEFSMLYFKKR